MKRYLVVADDFTGANDSGVQMRKHGIDVRVVLFPEEEKGFASSLVLDTESRNMPGEKAAALLREKAGPVFSNGAYDLVYKKVDSTLRGNIVEEVRELRALTGLKTVVFCPAFPKIRRLTRDNVHYLNEQRLMETEFARDPEKPIQTDVLTELITPLGTVCHHRVEEIRKGEISLEGADVHTFDAERTSDLMQIAALAKDAPDVLWVGSSGLANAIFDTLYRTKPVLAVVGSISEVSLNQMAFAVDNGVGLMQIPAEEILQGELRPDTLQKVCKVLSQGEDVIVTATKSRADYEETVRLAESEFALSRHEAAKRVQSYLAALTKAVLERVTVAGLFLTGGDTAIAVIRALEGSGCTIRREVLTAIVLSTLSGGVYEGLPMITKAGAFGKPEDLLYCMEKLKEEV